MDRADHGSDLPAEDAPTTVATTQWQERTLTFTNTSAAALTGIAGRALVGASGPGTFAVQTTGTTCPASAGTLAAGASCTVVVRYTGAANGAAAATLRLTAAGGVQIDQALSATVSNWGIPVLAFQGASTYVPHSITSITSPSTFQDRSVTITNIGLGAASGIAVQVSGAGFSLGSTTCGATLASNAACTAVVRYTTQAANGTFLGTLQVASNAPTISQPLSATVSGFVPPVWSTASTLPAPTASAYSVNLTATDANNDLGTAPAATRFQLVGGTPPPGLALQPVVGANTFVTLSGTLPAGSTGTYVFTIRATDAAGLSADRTFTLTVPTWTVTPASSMVYVAPNIYGFVYRADFTFTNRTATTSNYPGVADIAPAPGYTTDSVGPTDGIFVKTVSGCNSTVDPGESCTYSIETQIRNPACEQRYGIRHRIFFPNVTGLGPVDGPSIDLFGGPCNSGGP